MSNQFYVDRKGTFYTSLHELASNAAFDRFDKIRKKQVPLWLKLRMFISVPSVYFLARKNVRITSYDGSIIPKTEKGDYTVTIL